jgi:hypothetical protein
MSLICMMLVSCQIQINTYKEPKTGFVERSACKPIAPEHFYQPIRYSEAVSSFLSGHLIVRAITTRPDRPVYASIVMG